MRASRTLSPEPRPGPKPPFEDGDYPIHTLTRMRADVWRDWLARPGLNGARAYAALHVEAAAQALRGMTSGVDIGFTGARDVERSGPNLPMHSAAVEAMADAIIMADVASGKKAGPFDAPPLPGFACSPIGAVKKRGTWEQVRVIHHLSYPFGGDSVNASIERDELRLGRFDDACDAIRLLGIACLLIKLDVEAAYKQVPVRRADRALLGLRWRGKYYYELVLPFGLKSSGARWELYAAALHYFFQHHLGVELVIHYVDDFLFVLPAEAAPHPRACRARDGALALCEELGVPMATGPGKQDGPCTCLTFLGIELDTVAMEARLAAPRLAELRALLVVWSGRTECTVTQLQSLLGKLNFACQVVRAGRAWLRRLITLLKQMDARSDRSVQHRLTAEAKRDIAWWGRFLTEWNGVSLLYDRDWSSAIKLELWTDACGTGYGAAYGARWFQGKWTREQLRRAQRAKAISMPFLELHALVQAARTWGALWRGKKVLFHCDAHAVVDAVRTRTSKDDDMQALLRCLTMTAALSGFDFRVQHIAGVTNTVADLLSRVVPVPLEQLRAALPSANAEPEVPAGMPDFKDM